MDYRYFILHKPFKMVSQFISPDKVNLLGDIDFDFPEGTHAIGRLDNHSEGLLILTTNKKVTKLLFESKIPHKRTYLVQVRGIVSDETLQQLRTGVTIHIKGGVDYITTPCTVERAGKEDIAPYIIIDKREELPHTWLLITLTEGKFHQVRKMTRVMRHACWRLIRVTIEDLALANIPPGAVKEIAEQDFFRLLKIDNFL